jgi:hypothetical protein
MPSMPGTASSGLSDWRRKQLENLPVRPKKYTPAGVRFQLLFNDDAPPLPAAMPNLCRFGRRIAGFLPSK